MSDKLLPCPGCGNVPDLSLPTSHYVEDGGAKWGGIQCCWKAPSVRTGYEDWPAWKEEAIQEWNTRACQPKENL